MSKEYLKEHFQAGDIIFFRDVPDNPGYHYSYAARALNYLQSWFEVGDSAVIHVGMAHHITDDPAEPGNTDMILIDSMPPTENDRGGVNCRPLVRHYAIEVFRLIDQPDLAKKALEIAAQFQNIDYSLRHCGETLAYQSVRGYAELNEFYTQHLVKAHLFNPQDKSIQPDTLTGGMNCSEFVITCYQLGYLAISPPEAIDDTLPEFIRLHAHTSPAKFHDFIVKHPQFFKKIEDEPTLQLKNSGTPRPEEALALVPYSPPVEQPVDSTLSSWASWFSAYAYATWNLFPVFWSRRPSPPSPIELSTQLTKTLRFQETSSNSDSTVAHPVHHKAGHP